MDSKKKRLISLTMSCAIAMTTSFSSAAFSDIANHWGKDAIETWETRGVISGYNGLFRPKDPVTRGEMAVILNNLMKYEDKASNTFSDLGQFFYTDAILKANKVGIINGDGKTVRPKDNCTRQEAAVMLCKALGLTPNSKAKLSFSDSDEIAAWAKPYVATMAKAGYIKGYENKFNPKANITRVEVISILNNAIKELYNAKGTYKENVNGIAVINTDNVKLKDMKINGSLIIAEGVGNGDVYLDNVSLDGNMIVRGGGDESIHIIGDTAIDAISIDKQNKKPVRIVTEDDGEVKNIEITNGKVILDGEFETVTITDANEVVIAEGAKVKEIVVLNKINLEINGNVEKVTIEDSAEDSQVEIGEEGEVEQLVLDARVDVENDGEIAKVKVNADDVVIAGEKPKDIVVASKVDDGPVDEDGEEIAKDSFWENSSGSGSSSGGGSSSSTTSINISNISKAILAQDNLCSDYTVSAKVTSGKVKVTVKATELEEHENAEGIMGHWIGFALTAPTGADSVAYAFGTESNVGSLTKYDLESEVAPGKNGVAFYTDAGDTTPKKYVKVQWYNGTKKIGKEISYEMDLTNVTLKAVEEVEEIDISNLSKAKLATEDLCSDYSVSAEVVDGVVEVTVVANELEEHENAEGNLGHWIGFALTAPSGANKVAYAFETEEITGELVEYELEANVVGTESGVAFYADATDIATAKKYVKVQWYNEDEKVGNEISYEMDITGVTLKEVEEEIDISNLSKAKLTTEDLCSDYSVSAEVVDGVVEVTVSATELEEHENAEGNLGHWIGFALTAPTGANKVAYAFETEEITVELVKHELEANVVGTESGVAFYTDAGDTTPKKYVKVQWYNEDEKVGNEISYEMDITGVTLK